MIMICFVHGCSDARYRGPLETMFEDRKRLFVDLLGWDLSVQDARWEIDQFDDDDAVYLIALDQNGDHARSEEHTSDLQSLMRNSYAVFCLKKKNKNTTKKLNKLHDNYQLTNYYKYTTICKCNQSS